MFGACKMSMNVTNNPEGGFIEVEVIWKAEDESYEIARESHKVFPNCTVNVGPFAMVMRLKGAEFYCPIETFTRIPDSLISDTLLDGAEGIEEVQEGW